MIQWSDGKKRGPKETERLLCRQSQIAVVTSDLIEKELQFLRLHNSYLRDQLPKAKAAGA
jgi:hypothetical protein